MTKKLLYILGGAIILVGVFALGWMLATRFGGGLAVGFGPGMMNGYTQDMPGMMRGGGFMHGGFFGGGMFFQGGLHLLGWLVQIGLIVAIVTWLVKRQIPAITPPSAPAETPATTQN